ncbi:hypothetical protein INR49_018655 [Caranx melampygus]|nr:hypothetical protein INR49_018655 [Caranx melampygus]
MEEWTVDLIGRTSQLHHHSVTVWTRVTDTHAPSGLWPHTAICSTEYELDQKLFRQQDHM